MAMGARGLAKALHRKKINQLAEDLQQTKLESGSAGTEADNILREGWSKLISSHLNPKAINRSSRDCRICHTEL
jgi:hypothetical protein